MKTLTHTMDSFAFYKSQPIYNVHIPTKYTCRLKNVFHLHNNRVKKRKPRNTTYIRIGTVFRWIRWMFANVFCTICYSFKIYIQESIQLHCTCNTAHFYMYMIREYFFTHKIYTATVQGLFSRNFFLEIAQIFMKMFFLVFRLEKT